MELNQRKTCLFFCNALLLCDFCIGLKFSCQSVTYSITCVSNVWFDWLFLCYVLSVYVLYAIQNMCCWMCSLTDCSFACLTWTDTVVYNGSNYFFPYEDQLVETLAMYNFSLLQYCLFSLHLLPQVTTNTLYFQICMIIRKTHYCCLSLQGSRQCNQTLHQQVSLISLKALLAWFIYWLIDWWIDWILY